MNCDHCDKPALVHEVVIRNGKRHEVHLCEEHARAIGYLPAGTSAPVILGHVMSSIAKPTGRGSMPTCGNCGLTLAHFRQTGLLGCAECYEALGQSLATIIEKEQAGHCGHVGKRPRRGGGGLDTARLRQRLMKQLDEAVGAEQYERAAKLRDQLLALKNSSSADHSDDSAPTSRAVQSAHGEDDDAEDLRSQD